VTHFQRIWITPLLIRAYVHVIDIVSQVQPRAFPASETIESPTLAMCLRFMTFTPFIVTVHGSSAPYQLQNVVGEASNLTSNCQGVTPTRLRGHV
jgi:hypothetical protein